MGGSIRLSSLGALALVAACSDSGSNTAATNSAAPSYADQIRALPEAQRHGVFIRAIRDAQQTCQGVTRSVLVGERGAVPFYEAYCTDGPAYRIAIVGQSAQVTPVATDDVPPAENAQ